MVIHKHRQTGINEIHKVEKGDLVFVDHPKYYNKCLNSAASFIIINKETEVPEGKALLIVENPFEAYCRIVQHFRPFEPATKLISDSARIGEGSFYTPAYLLAIMCASVKLHHPSQRDHHGSLHHRQQRSSRAGTVIGSDAFLQQQKTELWCIKMPSCGRVIIEDDVEIGAGCTIDRGVSHDSIIGRGTKMDNMIHIGA